MPRRRASRAPVAPQPRIGLALGGGAARGWAHIGVIQALEEEGIEPAIVCGTSMGALVGAAYVSGQLDRLASWAENVGWREIVRLLDLRFSGGGLVGGERLMRFLDDLHEDRPIEDLPKPFAAVATELASGREVWLREGSLLGAVRASIALPGLLSPSKVGDHWLVDGALVDPVPVMPCRALGADAVIAVNVNGDLARGRFARSAQAATGRRRRPRGDFIRDLLNEGPSALGDRGAALLEQFLRAQGSRLSYVDVVMGAINVMQDYITRSRMAGEPPDVMLTPRIGHIALLEFHRAGEAIEEGRRCVRRMLPGLRDVLGEAPITTAPGDPAG